MGWLDASIMQKDWGHRAQKKTWLYIVGCDPRELPEIPIKLGEATHVVSSGYAKHPGHKHRSMKPEISKAEREHTPPLLGNMASTSSPKMRTHQVTDCDVNNEHPTLKQ